MEKFEITLKNEKSRLYTRFTWLIIIINSILLLYFAIYHSNAGIRLSSTATLVCLVLCFIVRSYFQKRKWKFGFYMFFVFLIIGWIKNELYLLAALSLFFGFLSLAAAKIPVIYFSKEKIIYPAFFPKTINWSELINVILKDGILTINFKNNKFIQQYIDETKAVVNEREFNDFCSQQLNK